MSSRVIQQKFKLTPQGEEFIRREQSLSMVLQHITGRSCDPYDEVFFTDALLLLCSYIGIDPQNDDNEVVVTSIFERTPTTEATLGLYTFKVGFDDFLCKRGFQADLLSFDNPPAEMYFELVYCTYEVIRDNPKTKELLTSSKPLTPTEEHYQRALYFVGHQAAQMRDITLQEVDNLSHLVDSDLAVSVSMFSVSAQNQQRSASSIRNAFKESIDVSKNEYKSEKSTMVAVGSVICLTVLMTNSHTSTTPYLIPLQGAVGFVAQLVHLALSKKVSNIWFLRICQLVFTITVVAFYCSGIQGLTVLLGVYYPILFQTISECAFTSLGASITFITQFLGIILVSRSLSSVLFTLSDDEVFFKGYKALVLVVFLFLQLIFTIIMPQADRSVQLGKMSEKREKKLQASTSVVNSTANMFSDEYLFQSQFRSHVNYYNDIGGNFDMPIVEKRAGFKVFLEIIKQRRIFGLGIVLGGFQVSACSLDLDSSIFLISAQLLFFGFSMVSSLFPKVQMISDYISQIVGPILILVCSVLQFFFTSPYIVATSVLAQQLVVMGFCRQYFSETIGQYKHQDRQQAVCSIGVIGTLSVGVLSVFQVFGEQMMIVGWNLLVVGGLMCACKGSGTISKVSSMIVEME